jgi:hypothetical protein
MILQTTEMYKKNCLWLQTNYAGKPGCVIPPPILYSFFLVGFYGFIGFKFLKKHFPNDIVQLKLNIKYYLNEKCSFSP